MVDKCHLHHVPRDANGIKARINVSNQVRESSTAAQNAVEGNILSEGYSGPDKYVGFDIDQSICFDTAVRLLQGKFGTSCSQVIQDIDTRKVIAVPKFSLTEPFCVARSVLSLISNGRQEDQQISYEISVLEADRVLGLGESSDNGFETLPTPFNGQKRQGRRLSTQVFTYTGALPEIS